MGIKTKALQKTAPQEPFRVVEIERRDLRADDVLIDIKAAGICHSDIHTIRNEWGEAHFPLTVGHEIAGVVSAVGDEVTKFQVGDRVASRASEVKRMTAEGHEVANHTWDHTLLNGKSAETVQNQISKCNNTIESVSGVRPRLMREKQIS